MATEKKDNNGLLDSFSFDEDEDFFAEPKEKEKKEVKKDEEDDDVKSKKKKEVEDEEGEEATFNFDDEEDKEVEDKKVKVDSTKKEDKEDKKDEKEVDDKEASEEDYYTNLALDLKDRGILANAKIEEGKKLTEDEFFKMQDDEFEDRLTETFEALFEEIGEDGSKFLAYVKNGGNPRTFLNQVSKRFSLDELDVEDTNQVNKTLTHYFSVYEKVDEEDIEDKIKWLEDSGKKKAYATKYFKTIKDSQKEEEDTLLKEQEQSLKNKQLEAKEFNDSLRDVISKTETVGSFNLTKKEHKEIGDYITKATVKVGKNSFIPEFQKKLSTVLRAKTEKDKQQLIIMAKILKEDFKLEDLETTIETKVTNRAKSRISDKKNILKSMSTNESTRRSLAELMT